LEGQTQTPSAEVVVLLQSNDAELTIFAGITRYSHRKDPDDAEISGRKRNALYWVLCMNQIHKAEQGEQRACESRAKNFSIIINRTSFNHDYSREHSMLRVHPAIRKVVRRPKDTATQHGTVVFFTS